MIEQNLYNNTLEFIRALKERESHKCQQRKLSYTQLAHRAGFKSRAFVSDIFNGKKRITENTTSSIIRMLNMNESEQETFFNLLNADRNFKRIKNESGKVLKTGSAEKIFSHQINHKLSFNLPESEISNFNQSFNEWIKTWIEKSQSKEYPSYQIDICIK